MPTAKRKISSLGIYHVIYRGINKQDVFEDAEDFERFLETLRKYQPICGFELLGYCLMSNHVHLIVGSLFQSPFKSTPINSNDQLLTAVRYVHCNPVKAGICPKPQDYKYSSFKNYYGNNLINATMTTVWTLTMKGPASATTAPKRSCMTYQAATM